MKEKDGFEMKTLVAYFTRTGNTKVAAKELAKKLDCDIEEIVDNKKRTGVIGSTGAYISPINKKTTIKKIKADLEEYDMVILGTPIWWYTISPATREFVKKYKGKIDKFSLLYTCDKDIKVNAEKELKELFGKAPVLTMGIESGTIKRGKFKKKLDKFKKKLNKD